MAHWARALPPPRLGRAWAAPTPPASSLLLARTLLAPCSPLAAPASQAGVHTLVLPAAHETVETWKNGFGFADMPEDDCRQAAGAASGCRPAGGGGGALKLPLYLGWCAARCAPSCSGAARGGGGRVVPCRHQPLPPT